MCKFIKRHWLNKLRKKHDKKMNSVLDLEKKIVNSVFDDYLNKEDREALIADARKSCYSEDKIAKIELSFEHFSIDITYNDASEIIEAQNHISQHNKEGFLSKIANVISTDAEEDDE